MNVKRQMMLDPDGLIVTALTDSESATTTPAGALAAWESANRRRKAAEQEQIDADTAWIQAAKQLAEVIDTATGGRGGQPVMIRGKVVEIEFDDYWKVTVRTPEVIG